MLARSRLEGQKTSWPFFWPFQFCVSIDRQHANNVYSCYFSWWYNGCYFTWWSRPWFSRYLTATHADQQSLKSGHVSFLPSHRQGLFIAWKLLASDLFVLDVPTQVSRNVQTMLSRLAEKLSKRTPINSGARTLKQTPTLTSLSID